MSTLFKRRLLKLSLFGTSLLALVAIAFCVLANPTIPTFAKKSDEPITTSTATTKSGTPVVTTHGDSDPCQTHLSAKVPGKILIATHDGCENFAMRLTAQKHPTQLKVCPQSDVPPMMVHMLINTLQETSCWTWTAQTGEWHTFFKPQTKLITYPGFLVVFKSVQDYPKYAVTAEVQQ